jgi:NitT/TauT family transport system ATP-binding protein
MIRVRDVSYVFPGTPATQALHRLSLSVNRGEFVALVGASGSGKSTLLRLIAGLLAAADGSIEVDGLTPAEARRNGRYGFAFQSPALLPWRTVRRNLALPLELQGAETTRRVDDLLDRVGLSGFQDHLPDQLSGGMRQLAGIARALAADPPVLLLDEPFAALDAVTREAMNDRLARIAADKTVLLVTHSIDEAVYLADRVCVLSPRPGNIFAEIDIPNRAARTPAYRQSDDYFARVTQVRHALGDAMQTWLPARVVYGDGRGKTLGFPTLNLALSHLPFDPGVHAARVRHAGKTYDAALHIGPKSTFGGKTEAVEAFLLDADITERPDTVELQVLDFIRPTVKFAGADALVRQMEQDVAAVRERLARK